MDKIREEFEKWCRGFHIGSSLERYADDDNIYIDWNVQNVWRAWQAAKSAAVPVAGEVVAWRWFDSMDELVISQLDPLELGINASVLEPLIVRPTTSITAAELDALRKKAARWEHFKRTATWIDSRDDGIKWVIYYDMPRPEIFGPTAGMDEAADKAIAGEKK